MRGLRQISTPLYSSAASDEYKRQDWLHCVVAHRKEGVFPEVVQQINQYDIVAGKIADDATNFTIVAYLSGAYGNIGSEEADRFCISRLLPERLKDQFCFRTERAIGCLDYIGLSLIHISEPTRQAEISYAVFCLKKKKQNTENLSLIHIKNMTDMEEDHK